MNIHARAHVRTLAEDWSESSGNDVRCESVMAGESFHDTLNCLDLSSQLRAVQRNTINAIVERLASLLG